MTIQDRSAGSAVRSSERAARWAATMAGHAAGGRAGIRFAHAGSPSIPGEQVVHVARLVAREEREAAEADLLAPLATQAVGGGRRAAEEEADPWRTCFERDRDRILHATAFRRLAGKTQVFVHPEDHQRTRLTHALEVAQVATSVARACGLNVALTEAIALGHDCGHGPGGHASEDALAIYLPGGFDHAPWGADVSLASLNLCEETADGIRNHSWSRPAPATPEGEVVSWADRIAYVCHDWEDALAARVVLPRDLPEVVRTRCGTTRSRQLDAFIRALVTTVVEHGVVAMSAEMAEALAAFRACNYERIYLREESVAQGRAVVQVLRALVEHFAEQTSTIEAVTHVAGMTDRYAFRLAVERLGWDPARLPVSPS